MLPNNPVPAAPVQHAVIYARYSSDKQTEDSIEAQLRACNAYAEAKGYTVVGIYKDEAISGKGSKTASRTQYQKLQRDCDKGQFSIILVHKYDRIARSMAEHINLATRLQGKGVELIATAQDFGTSNEAKIMRSLMWALSEYYIDNLSDEVKKGHRENALKALHNGGVPPFGYDVVAGKYVINELEATYVRKLFNACANRIGYVDIVAEMERNGIVGKRGRPVRYSQIYEMLHNEKYTGVYVYSAKMPKTRAERRERADAIRIEGSVPQIIDRALFDQVQQIMSGKKQVGNKANYLCSGLVYCGSCGAKMHGIAPRKNGHQYFHYYCSAKCGARLTPMQDVDAQALSYLHRLLAPDSQKLITDALVSFQSKLRERLANHNTTIKREIAAKQRQYDSLMNNLTAGELPASVVTDIGQKLQALKNEMEALRETPPPHDFTAEQIKAWLSAIKATPDERAVHLLVDRITVYGKTDIRVSSTLASVLGDAGWGSRI